MTRPLGNRGGGWRRQAARAAGFSAETHKRFGNKLQNVIDLAKAEDLKALRAFEINPVGSSPQPPRLSAHHRLRSIELCLIAVDASTGFSPQISGSHHLLEEQTRPIL